MRILKKSLSLLMAVAMIFSFITVNAADDAGVLVTFAETEEGSSIILKSSEDQVVYFDVYYQTLNDTALRTFGGTFEIGNTEGSEIAVKMSDDPYEAADGVNDVVFDNPGNKYMMQSAANGKIANVSSGNVRMPDLTKLLTVAFVVPANTPVGEYTVTLIPDVKNSSNQAVVAEVTAGTITVIEETYIYSINDETVGEVEYAAAEVPDAPEIFTGVGETSTGEDATIEIADGIVWDDEIDTLQAPGDYEITGTVETPEIENLYFVSGEDRVDTLPAKYTYTIVMTDDVVVDSAAVEVLHSRNGADITDVLTFAEYATEIETVNVTAAESDGAAVFAAGLDWENAEITGGTSLDVAVIDDFVTLSVPLTGESVHYNLSNAVAEVTFTVVPAEEWVTEIEDSKVTIEYAAEAPEFPASVTGQGKTASGDTPLDPAPVFDTVEWDDIAIDTTPDTLADQVITGTVAAPAEGLVKFKNVDYTADVAELTASFIVHFEKTDDITVEPVEDILVPQERDGVAITDVATIAAYAEGVTTTNVVATSGGDAAVCAAELDWASAIIVDGESLAVATLEDTVTLSVPLTGETDYYDVRGKAVNVTFVVVPAEIPGCAVELPITDPNGVAEVTFTMPTDSLKIAGDVLEGKFEVIFTVGESTYVEEIDAATATFEANGENTLVTVATETAFKDMGIGLNNVNVTFTVDAEYESAKLIFEENTFLTFIYGDVNGDAIVDLIDASEVVRSYLGQSVSDPFIEVAANVNLDDIVDLADASLIVRKYLGQESSLPVAP